MIIPAYNAHDTIDRAIGSIIMQTVRDDIAITISDDASPAGPYDDVVRRYSDIVKIQCLRLPENGGPGVARQYAIDRTDGEYMVFMDADDTLASAFAIETMMLAFKQEPDAIVVSGSFYEETSDTFVTHEKDMVWMHGKCYLRQYLQEHGIRFHPSSRANEDNGVNMIIKLTANAYGKKIITIPYLSYYWHYKPDSITRNNNCEYYFSSSYSGYVDNMIYAFDCVERILGHATEDMAKCAATIMCFLYCYWNEALQFAPDNADANKLACSQFYNIVYRKLANMVSYKDFSAIYNAQMSASIKRFPSCIPTVTIFDFITDMKER